MNIKIQHTHWTWVFIKYTKGTMERGSIKEKKVTLNRAQRQRHSSPYLNTTKFLQQNQGQADNHF